MCAKVSTTGYCEDHQHIGDAQRSRYQRASRLRRRADPTQAALDGFYKTPAWRSLSQAHRAKEPLCRHCGERGRITAAAVVDHIVELRDGGSQYDEANLQSLCHACHNTKTQEEKRKR